MLFRSTLAMGRARPTAMVSARDRIITAWHESGHAMLALVQEHANDPLSVTIVPRGPSGGTTWMDGDDRVFMQRSSALAQLVTAMGGRAAEELLLDGDFTQGASGDLQQATVLARKMITEYGMGETLHNIVLKESGSRCRIYAPVGAHKDLLAYLVRRLLENGANSSFVNQIVDEDVPPEDVAADPFAKLMDSVPLIPTGTEIFQPLRANARGFDLRLRLPDGLDGLEATIRATLKKALHRGNITLSLRLTRDDASGTAQLDAVQLDRVLDALDEVLLVGTIQTHVDRGMASLADANARFVSREASVELDMAYAGQTHTVAVPLSITIVDGRVQPLARDAIGAAFDATYRQSFGRVLERGVRRVVNLRSTVIGERPKFDLRTLVPQPDAAAPGAIPAAPAPKAMRRVHVGERWHDTAIHDRLALPVSCVIDGPAILEQPDTTVLVDPGLRATVDAFGNTLIEAVEGRS